MDLKGKNVLVVGLGLLGGGVATVKWLLKKGAKVTVTDLRSKEELALSLKKISEKKIKFVLGEHREKDFIGNDIIVVGPGVPRTSKFLKLARKNKKQIEDESTFFFKSITNLIIGVTGTRGKTTVVHFIAELLSKKFAKRKIIIEPIGNNPKNPFLGSFNKIKKNDPVVVELPSWQLEILPNAKKSPHIAVITNIYPDHLNTYKNIEEYASAKANIFKYQNKNDFLILNHDNEWTSFFLNKKPKAQVFFFSKKVLPKGKRGLFFKKNKLFFRNGETSMVDNREIVDVARFVKEKGEHNLENLTASLLSVLLYDESFGVTQEVIKSLHEVPFRQEVVYQTGKLKIVNDSVSTTPDATIVAIRRFKNEGEVILISGGTDKKLDYKELAKEIKKQKIKHLILLSGSATSKLIKGLDKMNYKNYKVFDSLKECVAEALVILVNIHAKKPKTIIFSPGASSFEKFKNEFDRGEQFNKLVATDFTKSKAIG